MPKIFLSYDQQIEKLKNEKNLQIDDEAYAKEILRQLLLRYLIKVENEIKSQVSYYFTEKNGENQKEYLGTANYNYVGKKNQRDIDRLIKILEGYVTKPTDYNYINHAQRKYGKNDLFSVVIALRYMLSDSWYKEFIKALKALIDKYLKKHDSISEQELYEKMGFPENWRKITRSQIRFYR